MDCQQAGKIIDDLVYGLFEPSREREARSHIASCPACSEELKKAEKRKNAFSLWKVAAPARDLTRAVMERVRNIPRPVRRRIIKWTFRATAAAAVLLIGLFTLYVMLAYGAAPTQDNLAVVAPSSWSPTAYVGLAFRFTDAKTGKPISGAPLSADLASSDGRRFSLLRTETDSSGRAAGTCRVPSLPDGQYRLIVEAVKGSETVERIVRPVVLRRSFQVYARTDQPLYRPGNPVRARAIVLDRQSAKPVSGRKVIFLLTRSNPGNRLARAPLGRPVISETSVFGVARAEFPSESVSAAPGERIRLTVEVDGEQTSVPVLISRAPMPRFRITCETEMPYYVEGETVRASVRVESLDGKPVEGLPVRIAGGNSFPYSASGRLAEDGSFVIPEFRAPGAGALLTVHIGSDENEPAASFPVISAKSPVALWPLPGSGILRGTDDEIFIIARRPDGTPAAEVFLDVRETGQKVKTDVAGLARVKIPDSQTGLTFTGNIDRRFFEVKIELDGVRKDEILITDRSSYRAGDTVRVDVLSSDGRGGYYVCLVRTGQVIAATTAIEDSKSQSSSAELAVPPSVQGMVKTYAFRMGETGLVPAATAAIFVEPPEGLVLSAETERETYTAGSDDTVRITVRARDENGNPKVVALPAEVTDAALFEYVRREGAAKNALYGDRFQISGTAAPLVPAGRIFPQDRTAAAALLSQRVAVRENVFEQTSSLSVKKHEDRIALMAFANRLIPLRFILFGCILFTLGALLLIRNFIRLASGEERRSIALTGTLGIAFAAFVSCSLAWHIGWGFAAGGGNPLVQALAHVLVPAGVLLAAVVILGILRRGADEEGKYNPVIFEAGALIAAYQLAAIFVPQSGAFAFRMNYLPFVAAALVFFAGSVLAVIRVRPFQHVGRSAALRTAGVLGPAIVTAVILALSLAPVGTVMTKPDVLRALPSRSFEGHSLYWNPMLVTDEKGEATVEFTAPGHAGTWVFHSDGISADGKLSAVSEEIRVTGE